MNRRRGPHPEPQRVAVAPGHLAQAETPVEGLGPVVDGEHVELEWLPPAVRLGDERADQPGADAAALVTGQQLDAGQVDGIRLVFHVEHAGVHPVHGDDLPATGAEAAGMEVPLHLLVPAPDGGDVPAHRRLVQPEAELRVGGRGGAQHDAGHAADATFGRAPGAAGYFLGARTATR